MYRPPSASFPPGAYGGPQSPVVGGPHPPGGGSPWQRPPPHQAGPPTTGLVWKEHQTPEGKKYWFNTNTRQSTWEKPEELLSPEEKALMSCPWKEYTTPEGKKYYSHSQTKETTWQIPPEYKEQLEKAQQAKERAEAEAKTNPATNSAAPAVTSAPTNTQPEVEKTYRVRQPLPSAALMAQTPAVEFATREEAEKAFFKLLKETNVKSDWTWEQAMRAIITNPLYRSLKTVAERKAAFHAYAEKEARRERELREEREQKHRSAFIHMLENNKAIKPYTRFKSAIKILTTQPAFQQIKSDQQREQYFNEYVEGLQRREKDRMRDLRKSSMDRFAELLRETPEITYETEWRNAQKIYMKLPALEDPKTFEGMDILDFLSVYEEHSRLLWEPILADLTKRARDRKRKERKARDGFKDLLKEQLEQNNINALTLWKEFYPHIKDDPRYTELLGLPQSSPIDLFWDLIYELEEQLHYQKKVVYEILKRCEFEVTLETPFETFRDIVAQDEGGHNIPENNLMIIYDHLKNKAVIKQKEERRRQERKLRRKMDNLRHVMKYIETPIGVEETWESVRPRLQDLPEFNEIEDEQICLEVFDKFIKRLKEKQSGQDEDDDEEGIIREDEEVTHSRYRRSHSRGAGRHNRHGERDSDHGLSDDERLRKRKRARHTGRPTEYDQPMDSGRVSAEEGDALDQYENDPRRQH
ncbi:hypothetical protein CLU79DRAFT_730816 [Phycomyces nitens]|nr:hypothetical protein CLU79DRAFT_730816 [Phycomyces nitens]